MNTIYVEDKNKDRLFIEAYLRHLNLYRNVEVKSAKGYTRLFSEAFLNQMKDTQKRQGKNIVIFDADTILNGGGFENRLAYLRNKAEEHGLELDIFLFPDHRNDGDFETLLEQTVPQQHTGLLECFSSYERCVAQRNNSLYKTPDRKNKLHTYIYTFNKSEADEERFTKDKNYCFDNLEYWNLNSPALKPLQDFLIRTLESQA